MTDLQGQLDNNSRNQHRNINIPDSLKFVCIINPGGIYLFNIYC